VESAFQTAASEQARSDGNLEIARAKLARGHIQVVLPNTGAPEQERIQLSAGTMEAAELKDRTAPLYDEGALVPKPPWRNPLPEEWNILTSANASAPASLFVAVVSLWPEAEESVSAVAAAARALADASDNQKIANNGHVQLAVERLSEHIARVYQLNQERHERDLNRALGGIWVGSPGGTTQTVHPQTRSLVGLHVDSWYERPVMSCHEAPNRISVNLGACDRFLLFLNLAVSQICERVMSALPEEIARCPLAARIARLPPEELHRSRGLSTVARAFLLLYPHYPVARLRVRSGEAYIAPTEAIVHDGSSAGAWSPDVTFSIRGYFRNPWQ
jgi:hypothetical protein